MLVDAVSGLRVARDDRTRQLRREVYEFWPTELLSIFRRAGVPRKLPPPFLPETDPELVARTGNPPRIIAPAAGSTYEVLNSDSSRKQGIPLRAKTNADVREVYWFSDKTFIGKSASTDILSWKSAPGRHELTALDDHGRSGFCTVTVR